MGNKWIFVAGLACAGAAIAVQTGKQTSYSKHYREGASRVELIGVCRVTEDQLECWDENGINNKLLEEDLKISFVAHNYQSVPIKYGQKTRIAFFKFTNPPHYDPRGSVSTSFEDVPNNWSLQVSGQPSQEGSFRIEFRGAVLITKLTDTVGTVRTTVRKNGPPSSRVSLKEGSSFEYLNSKFTVRKVVKAAPDPSSANLHSGERWLIALTAETSEPSVTPMGWVAIGHDGLVIRAVDKDGNPAVVDPGVLNSQVFIAGRPNPAVPKYFAAQISAPYAYGPRQGDDYPLFTNVNPSKIKEVFAVGNLTERIDITDIPLEPKR